MCEGACEKRYGCAALMKILKVNGLNDPKLGKPCAQLDALTPPDKEKVLRAAALHFLPKPSAMAAVTKDIPADNHG